MYLQISMQHNLYKAIQVAHQMLPSISMYSNTVVISRTEHRYQFFGLLIVSLKTAREKLFWHILIIESKHPIHPVMKSSGITYSNTGSIASPALTALRAKRASARRLRSRRCAADSFVYSLVRVVTPTQESIRIA